MTNFAVDASRRAALLIAYIRPVCALFAPCRAAASTPILVTLFLDGPLVKGRCQMSGALLGWHPALRRCSRLTGDLAEATAKADR